MKNYSIWECLIGIPRRDENLLKSLNLDTWGKRGKPKRKGWDIVMDYLLDNVMEF